MTFQQDKQHLILDNIRFVRKQVKTFIKIRGLSWTIEDELFQEGILGMCRAAQSFDPNRNLKFLTYAKIWVDKFIKQGFYQIVDTIKTPHQDNPGPELTRAGDDEIFDWLEVEDIPLDLAFDISRIKSQATLHLRSKGIKQRNINWYYELLEGELNQVDIAKKFGVSTNTVKTAMYQIRDTLQAWGKKMSSQAA